MIEDSKATQAEGNAGVQGSEVQPSPPSAEVPTPEQASAPTAKELATRAVATIQQMKADLVQVGAMVQWEADHYFEAALKHLNGVG